MRPHFLLLLFALALPAVAQEDETKAAFDQARAAQARGDHAQCRAAAAQFAERAGPLQAALLATLGSCLEMAGETETAIATLRRAVALAPDHPILLYNLAVPLASQKQYAEARELLKKAVPKRPRLANARYLLAKVFDIEGFRSAALLEYLRFLALDPATEPAKDAATRVLALLNTGVTKTGPKDIALTIDPSARTEEGDFKAFEMMLALASGSRFLEENEGKSEFDVTREQLRVALAMLAESPAETGPSYTATHNLPFFVALHERKLLDAYAARALSPLNLDGASAWQKQNAKALAELDAFLAEGTR